MKKILNVFILNNCIEQFELPTNGAACFFMNGDKNFSEELKANRSKTKAKYSVFARSKPAAENLDAALCEIEKANADIVAFEDGYCFKTAAIKNLPVNITDSFIAEIYCALSCKTIYTSGMKLFETSGMQFEHTQNSEEELLEIINKFNKEKSKLSKEVYTFVFNMICRRLETFYVAAMLAVYNKKLQAESIVEFDLKLKENIFLYLAMEKRFTVCDLKKQRIKKFKISFITANKLKKYLNTKK